MYTQSRVQRLNAYHNNTKSSLKDNCNQKDSSAFNNRYILSNKRNARNIKLNNKFILALKDSMSICVRYEYNKMFLSTTNFCNYLPLTWLIGNFYLRPITENGF